MKQLDVVLFLILLLICVISAFHMSKKKSPQRNRPKMIVPFPVKIKALKCQGTECKCQCGGTVEDVEEAIKSCWRKGACGFNRVDTNKLLRRDTKLNIEVTRPVVTPVVEDIEIVFEEPLEIYVAPPKKKKKK